MALCTITSQVFILLCALYLCLGQPASPTTVYLKIWVNQLDKIDGVEQTFSSDFYMTSYWEDSSITEDDFDEAIHWTPQIEFSNVLGEAIMTIGSPYSLLRGNSIPTVIAGASTSGVVPENQTWVKCDQRYVGDFLTELKLQDFPFDKQNAIVRVESALYNTEALKFQPYPTMMQGKLSDNVLPKGFEVSEWTLLDDPVAIVLTDNYYPVFKESYSQFRIDIKLQREATYYIWKIVSGIILLEYMSMMVFALAVEEADRMMGTLTVFLALVSFTFITGDDVPKVAYQTRIDIFINFSFFITFFMMLEHCLNYLYNEYLGEDNELADRSKVASAVDAKGLHGVVRFYHKIRTLYKHHRTRKIDFYFTMFTAVVYGIGVAIILGRPV